MYSEVTQDVKVDVTPVFLDTESRPQDGHFSWAYRITITNMGTLTVQLINVIGGLSIAAVDKRKSVDRCGWRTTSFGTWRDVQL